MNVPRKHTQAKILLVVVAGNGFYVTTRSKGVSQATNKWTQFKAYARSRENGKKNWEVEFMIGFHKKN